MRKISATILIAFLTLIAFNVVSQEEKVIMLTIDGAIGPAAAEYVKHGFKQANSINSNAIIIRMNTPGGLDLAMRDITQLILASKIPVITYVAPAGARAASAGTFILYASNVAAMAPGTNLGAASPVGMGGAGGDSSAEQNETIGKKAKSDAAAYIRSLAELRKRNVKWAEKAVLDADSLTAEIALKNGVIDFIAKDDADLLRQLRQRGMLANDIDIIEFTPNWRTKLLDTITNPNIAYILLLVGIYGLLLEFYNPGAILPGVTGLIALLLAFYALQFLPISFVGLGLIVIGIVFMALEAFVSSFGILAIGGVIAFTIGSIMLIDTDLPGFQIALPLIITMGVASAAIALLATSLTIRTFGRRVVTGTQTIIGQEGIVVDCKDGVATIKIDGEMWHADVVEPLSPEQRVKITAVNGLKLTVQPLDVDKQRRD